MLVIVFLFLVLVWVGGTMWKRSHRRKAEAAAAAMTQPVAWGPHQHQAFTEGHGAYGQNGAVVGKGKGKAGGLDRKGKGKGSMRKVMATMHQPV